MWIQSTQDVHHLTPLIWVDSWDVYQILKVFWRPSKRTQELNKRVKSYIIKRNQTMNIFFFKIFIFFFHFNVNRQRINMKIFCLPEKHNCNIEKSVTVEAFIFISLSMGFQYAVTYNFGSYL